MSIEKKSDDILFDGNNISAKLLLHGEDACKGIVGIQDAVVVLQGFQQFFQEVASFYEPKIKSKDFNLPVTISPGSIIVDLANYWWLAPLITGSAWFAKAFLSKVGDKVGDKIGDKVTNYLFPPDREKDFSDHLQKVPFLIYRVLVIAKHVSGVGANALTSVKMHPLSNGNICLNNSRGEKLEITTEELKLFKSLDPQVCSQLVTPVRSKLQLQYSCFFNSSKKPQTVEITEQDKEYLYINEEEDDDDKMILPELQDEHYYELEGEINRVTEKTCSLGFFYKGHTITSIPADKQLTPYKNQLLSPCNNRVFGRVRISGIIRRQDFSTGFMKNRPIIYFDKLELLETKEENTLF